MFHLNPFFSPYEKLNKKRYGHGKHSLWIFCLIKDNQIENKMGDKTVENNAEELMKMLKTRLELDENAPNSQVMKEYAYLTKKFENEISSLKKKIQEENKAEKFNKETEMKKGKCKNTFKKITKQSKHRKQLIKNDIKHTQNTLEQIIADKELFEDCLTLIGSGKSTGKCLTRIHEDQKNQQFY